MVNQIKALLLILFLQAAVCLAEEEVKMTAQIEEKGVVGAPLKGTITITHGKKDPVDVKSFQIGKDPLQVELLKESPSPLKKNAVVSIYRFTLPPEDPGLHVLPEVSAKVGNKTYKSPEGTFEVAKSALPSNQASKKGSQDTIPIVLKLEEVIEGETTLYPGQTIVVGYRFIFNFSSDLSKEDLPLLNGEGLLKDGAKDTVQAKEGDLNIFDVKQRLQAVKPGEFVFGPGIIQGRAYRIGKYGQKEIAPAESRAETKGLTIHVLPFPEQGKPTSFNGAIGTDLKFNLHLLSSDKISVGDKIELLAEISGNGELKTMPMPEICCQPGFSGFFKLSDLPPIEEISGDKKTFKVEMRALNPSIKEIPPLEFSYFNPKQKSYSTLKSNPIPLSVTPLKEERGEEQKRPIFKESKHEEEEKSEKEAARPESIEIEGNYPLRITDLQNLAFGTWFVLWIIPFGAFFLFIQIHMKKFMEEKKKQVVLKTSQDLFNEAFDQEIGSSAFFNLVQQAFLLRLVERGEIPSEKISPDYLPVEYAPGKVRALMREIEEKRFAGVGGGFDENMVKKIEYLFDELKH